MARHSGATRWLRDGFPHTRGDGPPCDELIKLAAKISPHAWGWPRREEGRQEGLVVGVGWGEWELESAAAGADID